MLKRLSGCRKSASHLGLLQLKSVSVISGWSTFRFLERTGTGDAEIMGVVGSEFQAARVVSPAGKPLPGCAGLLQCSASSK